jgi:NAD(P)-dependent dehydrogenase (short-subunit alcohol dehydrogenase family)
LENNAVPATIATTQQPETKQARNIFVSGGTSGVGRMIATGFAAAGHDVLICARTKMDCERVANEITASNPGTCTGVVCDLGKMESIEHLAQLVETRFGILHTLVNNAGAVAPAPLETLREEDWDRVVDINLKAVFFLTQKVVPLLRKAATPESPASVINIGSFAGARVGPRPHHPYTAAKAGLRYLTQSLARALAADHVNVNAIALGVFPQDSMIMRDYGDEALNVIRQGIPAGRFGEGKDIVGLTQFLSSPMSSYITGATIPLDGGMHI